MVIGKNSPMIPKPYGVGEKSVDAQWFLLDALQPYQNKVTGRKMPKYMLIVRRISGSK